MAVGVKICGLSTHLAVEAALEGGARYIGFVFYPPSPRFVTPEQAIELGRAIPPDVMKVGVLVHPDDDLIRQAAPALDALQLHGHETPERVQAIREMSGKTIIRTLAIGDAEDLSPLAACAETADMMLFDAKPPRTPGSLPGGNGLSFDWRLLQGLDLPCPWMLSGGLDLDNLVDAVRLCRADLVDVSSGVETAPGVKDPVKIRDFLSLAASLEPAHP